ncbi:MAG: flagellin/flagellar hook associated protein, partial [Firmicutes bacterium]|nr:flagellin/flagellar hook associated protein [Bacillota bacterium]
MIINHNMASVNTLRQMGVNEGNSSKSLQKLSSGLRINNAADDAAGLAISEKMRGQIRGLDQASRNSQDGISMIQTAEGSLNETHSILQRMKELATQSANDTNTTSDRSEIQKEMNQLTSEINRIGNTTEFNTQKLLKGKDLPVTTTTAATTTLSAGEAGVTQGVLSNFAVNANSIVGSASSTTVQASSSATTGKASAITQTTASTKAIKSAVTLTNGITFQANTTDPTADATLNTQKIEIKQATGASQTNGLSYDSVADKFTFTIGT